jgi:tRNA pseudouridine38-40 synthase
MARYFIEVAYKGTRYSGFQVQENAITIQSEIEKAFHTLHRFPVQLTGSSRTDAGVHALQNFFHFDFEHAVHPQAIYKLNAILPDDIVVRRIYLMRDEAHSRFDAKSREYTYRIHRFKDPFLRDYSLYYPFTLDLNLMQQGATYIKTQQNFSAFAKSNSQVKNLTCCIVKSYWTEEGDQLTYTIEANRFLRGMVRLITATLLKVGRGKMSLSEMELLFNQGGKTVFSVPAHGLYLNTVNYPLNYFSS